MLIAVFGLVGLGAFCGLFNWLVRLERRGRGYLIVGVCTALLLVEAALYPNQGDISSTLFYPTLKGQSFRLVQILIPLALAARWWASPPHPAVPPDQPGLGGLFRLVHRPRPHWPALSQSNAHRAF